MIDQLSERITGSLVDAGAVPPEDKALYAYGVKMGILMAASIATTVLIGLLAGMVLQSVLFLLAYNPVRSYSGGYHADSPLVCYLLSIPMILLVLLGIEILPWNSVIFAIVLFCAALTIEILAPVEDSHRPLDDREKVVYKKRSRVYTGILSAAAILLWVAGIEQGSLSIVMALSVAAVMLILGSAKNKRLNQLKGVHIGK